MSRKAGLNVATVAKLLLCLTLLVIISVVSTALAQEKPTIPREMTKLIVVYRTPRDPAEFDRYYAQVHTPLAKKYRGYADLR
jgi:hypothetical protein